MLSTSLLHRTGAATQTLALSHAEDLDRVQAIWAAQMIGQRTGGRFEHQPASTLPMTPMSQLPGCAPVDDDYYYEMVAVRAFEKYGIGLTVQQLGQQWLENNAGSWGSSEQAWLLLKRGIKPPDTGHPRYNKLWWTIGSQFSSDDYGVLNPGMPNAAAEMARRLGHINGYAEGTDGAVFVAGMIRIAFVENDPRAIVRQAAMLIHPHSPYRKCLDMIMAMADAGSGPDGFFEPSMTAGALGIQPRTTPWSTEASWPPRLVRGRRLSESDSAGRPCGRLRGYRLQCRQFRIGRCHDARHEGFAARAGSGTPRPNQGQRNGVTSVNPSRGREHHGTGQSDREARPRCSMHSTN